MTARSKTLATWLAFVAGSLGLHRFYLHGLRDGWGWLHVPPTLLGLYGVERMLELGQDDRLAWATRFQMARQRWSVACCS